MLLLDDVRIVPGASPETAFDQQMMQLNEPRHRHARRADLHRGAGDWIQHPCRHHRDNTGRRLDVNELPSDALFAVLPPDTAPVKRVPTVVDLDLLADMGRMTGTSLWAVNHGSSPAPNVAPIAPPSWPR